MSLPFFEEGKVHRVQLGVVFKISRPHQERGEGDGCLVQPLLLAPVSASAIHKRHSAIRVPDGWDFVQTGLARSPDALLRLR